jgi:hypothetical protein
MLYLAAGTQCLGADRTPSGRKAAPDWSGTGATGSVSGPTGDGERAYSIDRVPDEPP